MTDQERIEFAILQKSNNKRKYMHAIMPIVEKMLGDGFSVVYIAEYLNTKGLNTTSKSIYLSLYKNEKSVTKISSKYDLDDKKIKDKREVELNTNDNKSFIKRDYNAELNKIADSRQAELDKLANM